MEIPTPKEVLGDNSAIEEWIALFLDCVRSANARGDRYCYVEQTNDDTDYTAAALLRERGWKLYRERALLKWVVEW